MLNYWNIAVVATSGLHSEAKAIRRRLARVWTSQPAAKFTMLNPSKLTDSAVEQLDAVVLVVDAGGKHGSLVHPLALLDDCHVPVVALLDKSPEIGSVFEQTGVLIVDRQTQGEAICARIHGMLHRQREVNHLRREVGLARISHGGLGDEVAKMHGELELAALAQRELLPDTLPELHGVSVAALWRPAQYVSGDIYDVLQLDSDYMGIFLADAVGHGVSAALMTMVICQSLTTTLTEGSSRQILEPCEVLTRLNDQMIGRRLHPSRFATAVYAVIDCRSRRLAIAGAGHPPPLLLGEDGTSRALETSGGLLGVFENEQYDQVEMELNAGDRLLLYTDGFERAFPADDGKSRLPWTRYREEFEHLNHDSPAEMIDAVERRLDVQLGSLHQADDLTLLCIHAGPLPTAEQVTDTEKIAA